MRWPLQHAVRWILKPSLGKVHAAAPTCHVQLQKVTLTTARASPAPSLPARIAPRKVASIRQLQTSYCLPIYVATAVAAGSIAVTQGMCTCMQLSLSLACIAVCNQAQRLDQGQLIATCLARPAHTAARTYRQQSVSSLCLPSSFAVRTVAMACNRCSCVLCCYAWACCHPVVGSLVHGT